MRHRSFAQARAIWPATPRLALVALMLLAFVFQGYLVQTHIHKGDPFAVSVPTAAGKTAPHRDNFPANDDPANCPICQQIMQAGLFVAPAWAVLLLVALAVSTIEILTLAAPHYDTVSHSWRGRGPPRL